MAPVVTMATASPVRPNSAVLLVGGSHLLREWALAPLQSTKRILHLAPVILATKKLGVGAVSIVRRRSFCIRATNGVSDSGSVDSTLVQTMEKKIKEQLDADSVTVKDAYGDGRHVSIDVISSAFEGQSTLNRQRMVYKAIWVELQNTVHAVDQMTTRTPTEASNASFFSSRSSLQQPRNSHFTIYLIAPKVTYSMLKTHRVTCTRCQYD